MGEETQKFQRRTVLVKHGLQLKYAAIVFASVFFTAMIVGGDIYYTMARLLQQENPAMLPMVGQVVRMGLVKMAIFLGIMFLVSLFVSHRFAGPIYRFERSAQTLATGDLTHRVALRTGDDLMELQDEVNAMVAAIQRLVQRDRALAEEAARKLEAAIASGASAESLRPVLEELGRITRAFKV